MKMDKYKSRKKFHIYFSCKMAEYYANHNNYYGTGVPIGAPLQPPPPQIIFVAAPPQQPPPPESGCGKCLEYWSCCAQTVNCFSNIWKCLSGDICNMG
ncbi:hypothetical protein Patl1_29764 [Pistacia atlantica]|uniref:Uncharacterized protein n=1 Tax=Pistacia atlantica TaxID=434234 RepID=A0ACC1AF34_9ROSI|nr:hypothetical protein Patl1_29764 [Pistacia atlantica]